VKVVSLTVITSPADKEQVNFRVPGQPLIDELKRRILGQHPREIRRPGLIAEQIRNRPDFPKIPIEIKSMILSTTVLNNSATQTKPVTIIKAMISADDTLQ
jgi:hypothetical protein